MKAWQKLLLALIIMAAAILAFMYRQSNYESPESIVTAVPANSDNTQNGVPSTSVPVETTPTFVPPTQEPAPLPTPPVQVEVPEPVTPTPKPEYQDTNLPLESLTLGAFGAVRAYDIGAVDTNTPSNEAETGIPGINYDTLLQPMKPGMETEGVSQELSNVDNS